MTNEELDEARAKEAGGDPVKAARLAREGWTPPEPVDPDVLAFREWLAERWPERIQIIREGRHDFSIEFDAYLAGARMAREREQERAKGLVEYVEDDARRITGSPAYVARKAIAKNRGEV